MTSHNVSGAGLTNPDVSVEGVNVKIPVRAPAVGQSVAFRIGIWGGRIGLFVGFLLAWHFAVSTKLVPAFFVSTPQNTYKFLWEYLTSGSIWIDAQVTISETLIGFAIGSVLGVGSGLLLAHFKPVELILRPFLNGFNAMPRVALAPMFILWFGIGLTSKVVLAVSLVFFIALINTEAGIRSIEPDLLTMAKAMGANSRQLYLKVILPGSVPSIFAGLRLGAVYALTASVVGEMLAAQHGWGEQVTFYSQTFDVGGVFSILFILALFSVLLNATMLGIEKWLLRWQEPSRH
jgi:ABC-type nitrate/sulfonate/bicarbonate transport system permease component